METRDALLLKDREMDHAWNLELSYKGNIVDYKLDQLRRNMIAEDHALIIGPYYEKLD